MEKFFFKCGKSQGMVNSSEFPKKWLTLPGWNIQEFCKIFTPAALHCPDAYYVDLMHRKDEQVR